MAEDRRKYALIYDDIAHYIYCMTSFEEIIHLKQDIVSAIGAHGGWPIA